jgi:thiol-disulfide isomerase/thioredoxin
MAQVSKGAGLQKKRITWWIVVAVAAIAFGLTRLIAGLPNFAAGPYGAYAKGELATLSFKFKGEPAPQVAIGGPDGAPTSLAAFRGKAVLLNFWATWCAPCIEELPSLDALQAEFGGDKFQVVAVNMDAAGREVAAQFLAERKLWHLALYTDPNLLMDPALAGPGIPASVLYDAQGLEIARIFGATDWSSSEARALIERIVHPPKEK